MPTICDALPYLGHVSAPPGLSVAITIQREIPFGSFFLGDAQLAIHLGVCESRHSAVAIQFLLLPNIVKYMN